MQNSSFPQVSFCKIILVMTMTFSLYENLNFSSEIENSYEVNSASSIRQTTKPNDVHLFADKLSVPKFKNYIKRPRLDELLEKSLIQFDATLITGRAGTGKSALAANFARQYKQKAWFSVKAPDCDWNVFSSYFRSIFESLSCEGELESFDAEANAVSPFIESLLSETKFADADKAGFNCPRRHSQCF